MVIPIIIKTYNLSTGSMITKPHTSVTARILKIVLGELVVIQFALLVNSSRFKWGYWRIWRHYLCNGLALPTFDSDKNTEK